MINTFQLWLHFFSAFEMITIKDTSLRGMFCFFNCFCNCYKKIMQGYPDILNSIQANGELVMPYPFFKA